MRPHNPLEPLDYMTLKDVEPYIDSKEWLALKKYAEAEGLTIENCTYSAAQSIAREAGYYASPDE